jgi:PAS domain S-box-containing protein
MKILFLSAPGAAVARIAHAISLHDHAGKAEFVSCGTAETGSDRSALSATAEVGIELSPATSTPLTDLSQLDIDIVIALSANAAQACPVLPGRPQIIRWNLAEVSDDLPDPAAAYNSLRDTIRRLLDDFFKRGYLEALAESRHCSSLILDNISDGIIAHDANRRIFYFNAAAERITGYSRDRVMSRDCHEVFPGKFCSGRCVFCDLPVPPFSARREEMSIATMTGERKQVEMIRSPITGPDGEQAGALVSFRDVTAERTMARRLGEIEHFSGIIGRDIRMLEMFDLIRDLADSDVPVMILGESGTGKELVAAAIHNEGPRANALFVPVNCGALPESLLESELFGHVKGAFTGAVRDKKGRFELADGGTIFLDEVGDISPAMQVKLLRVLQEGKFERVGGEKTLRVNVRVISASNKDISEEIEAGRFREDLFYRLSVVPITLPPLRERRTDIPLLVDHVLSEALAQRNRERVEVSQEAMNEMLSYDWPGNVRELQNWIQFALIKCKGDVIKPQHLPPRRPPSRSSSSKTLAATQPRLDVNLVNDALARTRGNKMKAAQLLGVSRATLYRFIRQHGTA